MSKENKKYIPPHKDYDEFFDTNTISSTECTGLIPTPPVSEAEADSYSELYNIPKPTVEKYYRKKK